LGDDSEIGFNRNAVGAIARWQMRFNPQCISHPIGFRVVSTTHATRPEIQSCDDADEDGRAIELFGDAAEIRMERVARGFVAQKWPAVFGGEDQMNVNGGKGVIR